MVRGSSTSPRKREAEKPHTIAPSVVAILGKPSLSLGSYDIGPLGYQIEEFFVTGTASSYKLRGEATADRKWLLSSRWVPQPHSSVLARGRQSLPVRCEYGAVDLADVAVQGPPFLGLPLAKPLAVVPFEAAQVALTRSRNVPGEHGERWFSVALLPEPPGLADLGHLQVQANLRFSFFGQFLLLLSLPKSCLGLSLLSCDQQRADEQPYHAGNEQ
jgi:hypothetical protein